MVVEPLLFNALVLEDLEIEWDTKRLYYNQSEAPPRDAVRTPVALAGRGTG